LHTLERQSKFANLGKIDQAIASALRVHVSTAERTREKFVIGGLDFVLNERPHPPKPHKLENKQEAFLIATACSNPPSGCVRWTMQLLADHLINTGLYQFFVRLHIILTPTNLPLPRGGAAGGGVLSMRLHMEMVLVDSISDETIRQTLKKTTSNRSLKNNQAFKI